MGHQAWNFQNKYQNEKKRQIMCPMVFSVFLELSIVFFCCVFCKSEDNY